MADLIFNRSAYSGGPVDLVFGAGGEVEILPVTATGSTHFSPPGGFALAEYDNRNPARVSVAASDGWEVAQRLPHDVASEWGRTAKVERETGAAWQRASRLTHDNPSAWGLTKHEAALTDTAWERAATVADQFDAVHEAAAAHSIYDALLWDVAATEQITIESGHQVALKADMEHSAPHQVAQPHQFFVLASWQVADGAAVDFLLPWDVGMPIPPGLEVWPPPGTTDPVPRQPSTTLVFRCPPWLGGPVNLVFGRVCGTEPPVQPGLIVVPVRGVYMTTNSVTLTRVDTGDVLTGAAFRMSVDVDSWTWSWSAVVSASNQTLLNPDDPDPVEIAAVVNGVEYRLLIESVDRSRQFPSSRLNISGRGLAAELDGVSNYYSSSSPLTAQQLAAAALTENGESIGWAIDWGLTDWLVPANVWSYQGTRIGAVTQIANAAGGYILPHKTARTLRFRHSYPFAPWHWAAQTPDIELPADPVTIEGVKWHNRPDYNRVFVRGESDGVLGQVTIAGTAGDKPAPMVVDQLITHVDAARQRGLSVLGDTGRQAMVSISLPVLQETGVIEPGNLIRYNDGSVNRLGLVRSTSVDWSYPKLRQQLEIETHV